LLTGACEIRHLCRFDRHFALRLVARVNRGQLALSVPRDLHISLWILNYWGCTARIAAVVRACFLAVSRPLWFSEGLFWLCGRLLLLWTLLFSDKANFHPWVFIVVETHLPVVLVVVLVLKEGDPLSIGAYATVINDCLGDADTSELVLTVNQRGGRLAHDDDLILGELVGEGDDDFLLWLKQSQRVQDLLAERHSDLDVLLLDVLILRLQHDIVEADPHLVAYQST